jgi:hypothetical protein
VWNIVPSEERIIRITYKPGKGILAADTRGALHWINEHLERVASSRSKLAAQDPASSPVYALAFFERSIITRDKIGNVSRWDIDTLQLTDRIYAKHLADLTRVSVGAEPSPTILRGIGIFGRKAYLNNGYFQLVVIDLDAFAVEQIAAWKQPNEMLEMVLYRFA